MIKVNLKATGRGSAAGGNEFVADLDVSGLNLKLLIICAALGYGPGFLYFDDEWANEKAVFQTQLDQQNQIEKKLKAEEAGMANYQKQLEDLKSKEKAIKDRLGVVNSVIEQRNNPMKIMLYISENIPDDIWVKDFSIENREFTLKGHAISYKSIGQFISSLNDSIFFNQRVVLFDYKSKDDGGSRVQEFVLKATIQKYE